MRNETSMLRLGLLLTSLCIEKASTVVENGGDCGSPNPLNGQAVENVAETLGRTPRRRSNTREEENHIRMISSLRPVFRGDHVVDCAVQREMSLTARDALTRRALDTRPTELEKHELRKMEKLAGKLRS